MDRYGFRVSESKRLRYVHTGENPAIRVCRTVNARLDLEDLFCKLAINFPNPDD